MMMSYWDDEKSHTGDYELHYFHQMYIDGKHPVSFMIVYVSISFMIDSRPLLPVPTEGDVKKFIDEGVYNEMDNWNKKRYFMKEATESED